jgi:cytochrome c peroxidase
MHDGRFHELGAVLDFYSRGGIANRRLDDRILKFFMDDRMRSDLLAFIESLNGEGWQSLKAPNKLP